MLGAIARLNQQLPKGFCLIDKAEYIDLETPTFTRIPTHRQLVLKETQLKRDREAKLDELTAYYPPNKGRKRMAKACDITAEIDVSSIQSDEVKIPNPNVFPRCQTLLTSLMDHT
jgi:hypothetical protein